MSGASAPPVTVVVDGIVFRMAPSGGVARVFREVLPRVAGTGAAQIELIVERGSRDVPVGPGIRQIRTPAVDDILRPRRVWWAVTPAVRAVVQRATTDAPGGIWHSTYFTTPVAWHGAEVVTVHDMIYELYPRHFPKDAGEWFRRQKRKSVARATRVICVSQTTADDVCELLAVRPEMVTVTPLGVAPEFRVLETERPTGCPYVLYVGLRHWLKGWESLVRGLAGWSRGAEVGLVTVGPPLDSAERRLLEALGLGDRVTTVSGVGDDALVRLYNGALAFASPSRYEGFGIPLLEALACGCPLVASRIPSSLEVAGDCAVYFEPGDGEGLADALERAVTEGRDAPRVAAGIARAAGFTWDACAARTASVYTGVAGLDRG